MEPVHDIATLCLFPTPVVMGEIIETERFDYRSPLVLGTPRVPWNLQTPQLAGALQVSLLGLLPQHTTMLEKA